MSKGVNSIELCEKYRYWTDGEKIWEIKSFCDQPTVTLRQLDSDIERGGAIGCLNVQEFWPIEISRALEASE